MNAGSVTKISTIPRTSLFLTGSKDGDVKLWDARGSEVELIFHWEKMHDRHTFLQPSSRGFGAVVRVIYFTSVNIVPLRKLRFESAFYLFIYFFDQYMRFFFSPFKVYAEVYACQFREDSIFFILLALFVVGFTFWYLACHALEYHLY